MLDVTRIGPHGKWTADELAKRFQVIEPRWEKRKRKKKHFTLEWRRRRELQIVLQHRYPDGVPARIDIDEMIVMKAQIVGDSLGLTAKERAMWKITTIRPCDQTVEERAAIRKAKKRENDRMRRRYKRQSRAQYLAEHSLSKSKPWEQEGIGRRTWYRRSGTSPVGTSMSPTTYSYMSGAAPVPWTPWTPDGPPVCTSLAYLVRIAEYKKLTSGGIGKVVPGLAACSELRRVAA